MFQLLFYFSAIFAISSCNLSEKFKLSRVKRSQNENFECGIPYRPTGFISGGDETYRGEFPWLVAIFQKRIGTPTTYVCSGTLISSTRVVTAAHCIHAKHKKQATLARDLILYFGAHDLDDAHETDRLIKSPSEVIIHNGWNPSNLRFTDDIATLLLESEISFSKFIRPICMMSQDLGISDGVVAAWGKDNRSKKLHENLPKKLEIPITSNEECYRINYLLAETAWDKSFCAGKAGVGVCRGDSGAGFIVKHNDKFYFKGLVSSSLRTLSGCYTENYSIFTDVAKYTEFLESKKSAEEVITNNECGVPYSATSLIAGGEKIQRGSFPWMVAIYHKRVESTSKYICIGTLISSKKVITVAHCIHQKHEQFGANASDLILLFGAFNLDNVYETGRRIETPSKIIIHQGWDPSVERFNDDIAVLILYDEIGFTKYIRPICLMTADLGIDKGIVVGWGKSEDETKQHENIPRALEIPIVSAFECFTTNSHLAEIAWTKSFCAGRSGVGACNGDSGAGFYVKYQGKFYFKGLVSTALITASGCSTENYSVYTDIVKYSEFIGT